MGIVSNLVDRVTQDRNARHKAERDAPADMGQPVSRPEGAVGRVAADETGDTGLSGAEARGDDTTSGRTGAARDE